MLSPVRKSVVFKLGQTGFGAEKGLERDAGPSCLVPRPDGARQLGQLALAEVASARLEAVAAAPTLAGVVQVKDQVREQVVFTVGQPAKQNHTGRSSRSKMGWMSCT